MDYYIEGQFPVFLLPLIPMYNVQLSRYPYINL